MMDEQQASMVQDLRERVVELMRNTGPSESSSYEGSVAVRGGPRGSEPTSVQQTSAAAAAAARGGAERDTTAARQTTWRENASRKFVVTRR